ncbi:MAG: hypothetical protein NTX66_02280 [Candidatus Falkowbacteria bacterium]|nr:hypothetical protein [Candidatus Falkowbacteria bacterium]
MTCINTIRNLSGIKEIINACSAFGRTWGKASSDLYGSHIAFINSEEIVLLVQDKKSGAIRLLNFSKTVETKLGEKIVAELEMNEIVYTVG